MGPRPSTRDELIEAGLALNDELPLQRLFAGASSAAVAERAGVTTGAYFHHFRDATAFSDALVRSFLRDRPLIRDIRALLADAVSVDDWERSLPPAFVDVWRLIVNDPATRSERRGQMHLFAHQRTALTPEPGKELATVRDALREIYRPQIDEIEETWTLLVDAAELRLYGPMDARRLAVVLLGLLLGLEILHDVDPSNVDDRLYSDATIAIINAVTRPDTRPQQTRTAAEFGQEPAGSPQARSGARRREQNRDRVIAAAAGLFDDGWDNVRLRDVAEASGVSVQTVINLFGVVRRVCAATFRRHLTGYQEALDASMPERPLDAVRDALTVLARAASADPHPARALLAERLGVRLANEFDLSDDDVRVIAPFGIRIVPALAAITGREPTDIDNADLAATLIDTVLAHATPRPNRSKESVELALRLLPVG